MSSISSLPSSTSSSSSKGTTIVTDCIVRNKPVSPTFRKRNHHDDHKDKDDDNNKVARSQVAVSIGQSSHHSSSKVRRFSGHNNNNNQEIVTTATHNNGEMSNNNNNNEDRRKEEYPIFGSTIRQNVIYHRPQDTDDAVVPSMDSCKKSDNVLNKPMKFKELGLSQEAAAKLTTKNIEPDQIVRVVGCRIDVRRNGQFQVVVPGDEAMSLKLQNLLEARLGTNVIP